MNQQPFWPSIRSRRGPRLVTGLVVAAVAVLVAGCGGGADPNTAGSSDPYTIGVIGDISGPAATIQGADGVVGMQAAVHTINKAGGVAGRPIELRLHDTLSTAEGAAAAARAAIAEEPTVLFLSVSSAQFPSVLPVLRQAQHPVVSIISSSDILYPKPPEWLYLVSSTQSQIGQDEFKGVEQALGGQVRGKTMAFVGLASPAVDNFAREVIDRFQRAGGTLVSDQRRDSTARTFTSQAQAVVDARPDVVVGADGGPMVVTEVAALRTAGYTGPIVWNQGGTSDQFWQTVKDPSITASYVFKLPSWSPELAAAMKEAGLQGTSGIISYGWSAGWALADSFERCGFPCDRSGIIGALDTLQNFLPPGDVAFGPLRFTPDIHYWITATQYYGRRAGSDDIVPIGPPIDATTAGPPLPPA